MIGSSRAHSSASSHNSSLLFRISALSHVTHKRFLFHFQMPVVLLPLDNSLITQKLKDQVLHAATFNKTFRTSFPVRILVCVHGPAQACTVRRPHCMVRVGPHAHFSPSEDAGVNTALVRAVGVGYASKNVAHASQHAESLLTVSRQPRLERTER